MRILNDIPLKPFNTFGIAANAKYFAEITSEAQLRDALRLDNLPPVLVLSGGSNMLLTQDPDALILHMQIRGKQIVEKDRNSAIIRVMAGENWHELVQWTLARDLGGLENLSLIPGSTGTAPIQNIGAYGVEIKDVFVRCTAMDRATGEIKIFDREACAFGYRDSYFKNEGKNRYIITSVDLRLSVGVHSLNTGYGAIRNQLEAMGCSNPGIRDISRAVIAIRQSKLPDPKLLGNCGSFFKNPVIPADTHARLLTDFPGMPAYPAGDSGFKVPAGWLIEQCGFKGKRYGDAGVHKDQALVLVNYGQASGQEILDLARRIRDEVRERFGVSLEPEVNIIGTSF